LGLDVFQVGAVLAGKWFGKIARHSRWDGVDTGELQIS
jgi:hypothetical protein